jgi:hypothetical protein
MNVDEFYRDVWPTLEKALPADLLARIVSSVPLSVDDLSLIVAALRCAPREKP